MGYSTTLYAVDIDELKAAVGSGDAAILERVRAAVLQREGGGKRVDPTKGPLVRVTAGSEIYLDGKPVTPEEFRHALLDPAWAGTNMYLYTAGPARGERPHGPFAEPGSFMRFLWTLGPYFEEHGLVFKKHIIGIQTCNSEEAFASAGSPDEEITEDQAIADVITGKPKRRGCAHAYGYALEEVCRVIGTRLDAVGTDRLEALELRTPLSRTRLPVKLPRIDDFPYISYLDAAGVRAEVARLRGLDLSYPRDRDIEDERRRLLRALEAAAEQGRGVVGFYY